MENNNSDYIKWEPKFEIGIPVIDEQHKKLVSLCNTLYKEIIKSKSEEIIKWETPLKSALKECADYVQKHFHDEELLMAAAGYTDIETHKKAHHEFAKKILDTVNLFPNITYTDSLKFVRFLYDWVLSHIAHYDKLYVSFVVEYYKSRKEGMGK